MASGGYARELNPVQEDVHELERSCMLESMNLLKRFSSLLPVSSLMFIGLAVLSGGSTSCGSDQACFYFTEIEYEIDNACPSKEEALAFFQGEFCSSTIVSVDNDGVFDGETCCYDVTESDEFFGCGVGGGEIPPPAPGPQTAVAVGVGGSGGVGGVSTGGMGGMGGAGGSETCAKCAEFLTETNPPPLCDPSIPIYESYTDCKCLGPCATPCADSCSTQNSSAECESCMLDTMNGCGMEHQACVDDQ
jgi:hypothetical protein